MKNTLNYNLKLPEYADIADIADLNYNAKTIDAELMANFENGAGGQCLGYIEDGGEHTPHNTDFWISKTLTGQFRCLVTNSDTYVDAAKWLPIDDNSNASKLQNLQCCKVSGGTPMLLNGTLYSFSVDLPFAMEILCISANIQGTNDPSKEFLIIESYSTTQVFLKAIATTSSVGIEFELSIFARKL